MTKDQIAKMTPEQARVHFYCGFGDLRARLLLNRLAEREYKAGRLKRAAKLMRIERYLEDRIAYEMNPPPPGSNMVPSKYCDGVRSLEKLGKAMRKAKLKRQNK